MTRCHHCDIREMDAFLSFIINRYSPEGSKWWKIAKLKNENDYNNAFKKQVLKLLTQTLKQKNAG